MPAISLTNMDVDALLELRANVETILAERSRDLQRQLELLGRDGVRRGRPAGRPDGRARRVSTLRGVKVAPRYRGPGGETWAGRGAKPRWLTAVLKEGHSIEEFAIAPKGGRAANPGAKKGRKARRG